MGAFIYFSEATAIAVAWRKSARRCPGGGVPAAEVATQASSESDLESILDPPFTAV